VSLLREAVLEVWPSPAEDLEPVAHLDDPVERVAYATEILLRHVLAYEGAVRAMIRPRSRSPARLACGPDTGSGSSTTQPL